MSPTLLSPFVDATPLLVPNPPELSYGALMTDLDGDGMLELLVVTVQGPNRLYKWFDSRLKDVAPPVLADQEASGIGLAAADMTGNGFPDVYLLNTSAFLGPDSDPDRLLVNHGNLEFEDVMAARPDRNVAAGRSIVWVDVKGAGRPAAYVCNYAMPCRLYIMGEDGIIRDRSREFGVAQLTGGRSAVAADILGTGRVDLFAANEQDANRFYHRAEDGRFRDIAAQLGLDDPGQHARGLAVCDFDRDGLADLIWGNWEGPHRIMKQVSPGKFVDVADEAFAAPSRVRTVIVFDYDNDGWEDIFINNIGEPNRLFHNNGDGTFTEVDPGPLRLDEGLGTGATVGDLNGDGFLDVFVAHGESGLQQNGLFLNSPNGNSWLRIHVLTDAGAPATGAKVTLFAEGDGRPMIRFIDGGSGYLCQMEPVAHFGLGQAKRADSAEIIYTDGRKLELKDIPANHNVHVRPKGSDFDVVMIPFEE